MEMEKLVLGTVDYIILAFMLLVSAGIGVYFRFSGGKQKTAKEYLLAGQDMSILPVAFSLMATFISAITVIGVPAEMYVFGLYMAYSNIGYALGIVLSSYLTLPVFFDIQATTAYEYLEKRFGKLTRTLSSLVFVLQTILFMSVVLYAPALALSAVTNLPTWACIISIGAVCTFYCTLGGMKAVLWTDSFQVILMFLGVLVVLIKGVIDVDGIGNVFQRAYDGGRITVPGFDLDPEVRYTVWNMTTESIIFALSAFCGSQIQVQRLLTVKNVSRSRIALFASIPINVGFYLLNCLVGLVLYAHYYKCDPMTSPNKPISKADQLMPYFIVSSLNGYPGLPGLCICGVFSATLSTVSSAINSLTSVTMQDLVRPFFVSKGLSEKRIAFSVKIITFLYGMLCVVLAFLIASFGSLIQASVTVFSMLGEPLVAVFLLGMLTTRSNEKGVVIGLISAIGIAAWISFGSSANAPPPKTLPVSIEGCSAFNISLESNITLSTLISDITTISSLPLESALNATGTITKASYTDILPVYRISFLWFGPIGFASSAIIGYFASIIINLITGDTKVPADELLSPLFRYFLKKKSSDGDQKEVKISAPLEPKNFVTIASVPTCSRERRKEEYEHIDE